MATPRLAFSLFTLLLILATGGAHARQTPEARAAWQVLRYDLSASVNAAERALVGRAVISARNVGEGAGRSLTVRLNPAATVTSAKAGDATATVSARKDERTNLLVATLSLPATVAPGATTTVTVEYRLPVAENSGFASISPEGAQFLPPSFWYPTPNTVVAPRGADYAPSRLSVTAAGGETIISAGRSSADGFEQPLYGQPFFLAGRWETVEGAGEARGVSAHLQAGAGADERQRAEALVALAGEARKFYAGLLGPAPETQVRLVGVRRGAGFEMAGTLLVDHAVFRRTKTDSVTALQVAEAVARLWVGGAKGIEGAGAGAVREGLPRFLATLFLEQQFGKDVADKERTRLAVQYAPYARRDASLAENSPALDNYFNTAANKGALVWRIVMNAVGRDAFLAALRRELTKEGGNVSLASLRAALAEGGPAGFAQLLAGLLDKPTDTDLLVGLPQARGAGQAVALRNMGSFDVDVAVQATTDGGQRLSARARVPAKDFGEAVFQTNAKIVRVEVDPEKFYPQIDYANDVVPRAPAAEESVAEARAQIARGEFARAEASARAALGRAPLSEDARVALARAVLEQNRLDEAEKEFRAALDSPLPSPATLAWGNIGLGEIALRRNRAGDAAKRFDEAVRTDAEYASTVAARAARIKAETAAGAAPIDEQLKAAVAQLDAAIRTGRKAEIDAAIVPGELSAFSRGLIGTQPEVWQTRVLRTQTFGPNLAEADVALTTRALGRDASGTGVFVFARTPAGWKLLDRRFFELQ